MGSGAQSQGLDGHRGRAGLAHVQLRADARKGRAATLDANLLLETAAVLGIHPAPSLLLPGSHVCFYLQCLSISCPSSKLHTLQDPAEPSPAGALVTSRGRMKDTILYVQGLYILLFFA